MADDFLALQEPVGDGGIESVNFFNGRLLASDDMGREQRARQLADARLGLAMGSGVALGLEVSRSPVASADGAPALIVQPGLAISPLGQCLRLAQPERLRLTRTDSTSFAQPGVCLFSDCTPLAGGKYVAGEGLYLLTIAPAEVRAGRARANGLAGSDVACNTDRRIEAVQFRLLEVPSSLYPALDTTRPDFRNQIAYRCFGKGVLTDWATRLMAQAARSDDLLSEMAGHGLSNQEVPIALLGFTGVANLYLLDNWAVRRPVALADPPGMLHSLAAPRRQAVGLAMFEQFQQQLAERRKVPAPAPAPQARTDFPYLPPVGILPNMSASEAQAFLGGMTVRGPVHINSAQLEQLVRDSLSYPAIRSAGTEVVWLYAVAENLIEAARAAADPARADPYLVFASGNIAYRADARFNLHRWNYANYALGGS